MRLSKGILHACLRSRAVGRQAAANVVGRLAALATGITLAQIGEFSFVLASEAYRGALLTEDSLDLIVTVTILSMFLAPYMSSYAMPLATRILSIFKRSRTPAAVTTDTQLPTGPANHTFIIGFGPAGRRVADVLLEDGIAPAVIELNPKSAAIARKKGLHVHMVDATSSDAISHIGIKGACLVTVTVPDPRSAREIIHNLRFFSPESMFIARSRYQIASESLQAEGATVVIDEENTIGDELAHAVMESFRQVDINALRRALAGEKS